MVVVDDQAFPESRQPKVVSEDVADPVGEGFVVAGKEDAEPLCRQPARLLNCQHRLARAGGALNRGTSKAANRAEDLFLLLG